MIIAMIKGSDVQLSEHFNQHELDCRCQKIECHQTMIHKKTLESLEKIRNEYGYQVHITSGFRCQDHNKEVGGIPNSRHTSGFAVDIYADRLEELYDIAKKYFDYCKLNKSFIHCHNELYTKATDV